MSSVRHWGAPAPRRSPLLVTIAQAAEMLSLSRSSVYQLIWTEQLTPVRIGRSVRLSTDQLERFVAQRLTDSQQQTTLRAASEV